MTSTGNRSVQSKDGIRLTTAANNVSGFSELALARHFMAIPQNLGWQTGASLSQVRFKFLDGQVQVMVKASKGADHRVAFLDCRTWPEAVELLSLGILKERLNWRLDKYPPTK